MANLSSDDRRGNGAATSAGSVYRGPVGDDDDDAGDGSAEALAKGKWYALVVGIDTYSQEIGPLKGAVADANAMIDELERTDRRDRYEKVFRCIDKDASRAGLLRTFAELRRTLRGEQNARLFIYYAGHGIAAAKPEDATLKTPGYFLPHDARRGDKRSYLSMKTVERAINRLKDQVRHLLLVLDCCFAGAFRWSGTQFRNLESEPGTLCLARFKRFLREPSWHVITSSAQDERALDTIDGKVMLAGDRGWAPEDLPKAQDNAGASSPFAVALLRGLRGGADSHIGKDTKRDGDGVITGSELHFYIAGTFNEWERSQKNQRPLQKPMMFPWPTNQNCKGEYIFLNPTAKLALLPTPVLDEEHIPYCGLSAYQEKNKALFFGRDQAQKQLCERVKGQGRLTVVVGASGTGKSSLVFAGLMPCLRMEKDPAWYILTPRQPGQSPLAALEAIATDLGAPQTSSLSTAVEAWCREHPGMQLLMIIDQLEELITQSTTKGREEFLRLLGEAHRATRQLHVVLTLRSDFEPHFRELLSSPDSQRFLIPHVSRAELREMIERPADLCELSFESPQLVESLVDEVSDAPGALPLLSFTLREMVRLHIGHNIKQDQIDRTLRRKDYEKLGGISGALSQRADKIYDELDPKQQATLRRVLLRMVVLPERTRRRVLLSELVYDDPAENARVEEVKKKLVDERLLVTGMDNQKQACVEPVHDKLVMGWQKLCTFIEEDKKDLPLARSLTEAVQEWENAGGHSAKLWSGGWSGDPNLQLIRARQQQDRERFNEAETAFIRSSVRRQRNIQISIVGTALLTIVGLSIGFLVAKKNAVEAKKKAEEAYANLLISVVQRVKEDPLAVTTLLREPGNRDSMLWSQSALDVLQTRIANPVLRGHGSAINSGAFSPDGQKIVTGSSDKTVRIWNADGSGSPIASPRFEHGVTSAAFSRDGKRIVIGSEDGTARIWNADGSGSPIELKGYQIKGNSVAFSPDGRKIVGGFGDSVFIYDADGAGSPIQLKEENIVTSVAFSPDGKHFITGLWNYGIRVWNVAGSPVALLGGAGNVYSVAFSPDGKKIVEGSNDRFTHTVRIQNTDGTGSAAVLLERSDNFTSVAFSPDGKKIVAGNNDYTACIKNIDGAGSPVVLQGHEAEVTSVAFSPDGKKIVTGSRDQTARVWNTDGSDFPVVRPAPKDDFYLQAAFSSDGKKIVTQSQDYSVLHIWNSDGSGSPVVLKIDQKPVGSVAFSSDGKKIVIGSKQDTVRIFNADGSGSPLVLLHEGIINSVAFSPDGKRVASAGVDKTARIFNVDGSGVPVVLKKHENPINSVAFSSDGHKIVTGDSEGLVRMFNADGSGSPLERTHGGDISAVAFSPDGKRFASCGSDETARIWNADGSGNPVELKGHKRGVHSVAFSPDGKQVVTGGSDGTVRIWNADGSGSAVVLDGYKGDVVSSNWATFSPDGKQIVSMGYDDTMRIWTVASDLLVKALWSATNDCLPEHRRQQLLLESPAEAKQRHLLCLQEVARRRRWPAPAAP